MNSDKPIIWGAAAAVVALGAGLYWYGHRGQPPQQPEAAPALVAASQPEPVAASAPAPIEHPVPPGPDSAPMPSAVDQSDAALLTALTALPDSAAVLKQLLPQNIVRHIVAAVDNLPRKRFALNLWPFHTTPGAFMASDVDGEFAISTDNYVRYRPFVDMVKNTDAQQLATLYFHFYPLFQTAFDDLGYADGYFNDHVVGLIDHLLATPVPASPPALVQPNVMYLYADPALEALSAGQKTLIRMGPANEAALQGKLRELKAALLAHEHH